MPAIISPTKTAVGELSMPITQAPTFTVTAPLTSPTVAAITLTAPTKASSPPKAARTAPVQKLIWSSTSLSKFPKDPMCMLQACRRCSASGAHFPCSLLSSSQWCCCRETRVLASSPHVMCPKSLRPKSPRPLRPGNSFPPMPRSWTN